MIFWGWVKWGFEVLGVWRLGPSGIGYFGQFWEIRASLKGWGLVLRGTVFWGSGRLGFRLCGLGIKVIRVGWVTILRFGILDLRDFSSRV